MSNIFFYAGFWGLLLINLPQNTSINIKMNKDYNCTYKCHSSLLIKSIFKNKTKETGLHWGKDTEVIQRRVNELREESSLFNQILKHLEQSEYPYSISNNELESAYGSYSSKSGAVQFEVSKMDKYFFDATIIEEFVHAYQALYYNYTHGKFRAEREKRAIKEGKDYSKERKKGLRNWKKFGRKHAFIESEAKLITYFIQHQTCSITLEDIDKTDDYNTGGKGRKVINKYLERLKCFKCKTNQKLGHLSSYFIDLSTFAVYQQYYVKHWRKRIPNSIYSTGYFHHKPDALNNIYEPIAATCPSIKGL